MVRAHPDARRTGRMSGPVHGDHRVFRASARAGYLKTRLIAFRIAFG
jgi:hypothetical protein